MNNCFFCSEGKDFSYSRSIMGEDWPYMDRVVYSNDHVYAVAGYGPQIAPYVLVIPFRHMKSMADMNSNEIRDFERCLYTLNTRHTMGRSICFFEHGGSSTDGSSSIDHCHIHVINGDIGFFDYEEFEDYEEISWLDIGMTEVPYFLVGQYIDGNIWIKVKKDTRQEHQYLRKVLAKKLGLEQWDWKENQRADLMLDTMEMFRFLRHRV